MGTSRRVIIIGGGIGGLCAAIALRRVGIDAQVFERTRDLRDIGAGLSLWPNALAALRRLGLADVVRTLSGPPTPAMFRTAQGSILVADQERTAGTAAVVVFHRAELVAALSAALDANAIHLNAMCVGFTADADGVTARFADGTTVQGEALIGADGIHSVVRAQSLGHERPRYAGYTAWRAVTAFPYASDLGGEWLGRGQRFGLTYLRAGRVYWYASKNTGEGGLDARGGRKQELLDLFSAWHEPIRRMIAATDEAAILRNDIYDRLPITHWGEGRVTLLGDAAHPMTPNLGQGACQAMEDAVVLSVALSTQSDVSTALRTYEMQRSARTQAIVTQSWRMGKVLQSPRRSVVLLRNIALRLMPPSVMQKSLEWIVTHEV